MVDILLWLIYWIQLLIEIMLDTQLSEYKTKR